MIHLIYDSTTNYSKLSLTFRFFNLKQSPSLQTLPQSSNLAYSFLVIKLDIIDIFVRNAMQMIEAQKYFPIIRNVKFDHLVLVLPTRLLHYRSIFLLRISILRLIKIVTILNFNSVSAKGLIFPVFFSLYYIYRETGNKYNKDTPCTRINKLNEYKP